MGLMRLVLVVVIEGVTIKFEHALALGANAGERMVTGAALGTCSLRVVRQHHF
jgi:hypothetical protein